MKRLSSGEPPTLGTYLKIAKRISPAGNTTAIEFFEKKISESSQGEAEEVTQDEAHMMHLIEELLKEDIED